MLILIKSFNEVPIQYRIDNKSIYGIIDRLVIHSDYTHIIDYKTHTDTSLTQQQKFVELFTPQLQYYSTGINKLWPDKPVKASILFTHNINLIDVDLSRSTTTHV